MDDQPTVVVLTYESDEPEGVVLALEVHESLLSAKLAAMTKETANAILRTPVDSVLAFDPEDWLETNDGSLVNRSGVTSVWRIRVKPIQSLSVSNSKTTPIVYYGDEFDPEEEE